MAIKTANIFLFESLIFFWITVFPQLYIKDISFIWTDCSHSTKSQIPARALALQGKAAPASPAEQTEALVAFKRSGRLTLIPVKTI